MVAEQLEARGIRDSEVLRAFATVERHSFVDEAEPYGDHALPVGSGQTISQPYVVARMTELARPPKGWNGASILEVGTGSGYQAAILAELGARVTGIERIGSLAAQARDRLRRAGYSNVELDVAVAGPPEAVTRLRGEAADLSMPVTARRAPPESPPWYPEPVPTSRMLAPFIPSAAVRARSCAPRRTAG